MDIITSNLLSEDIIFLKASEPEARIENKNNLVVYSYAEQHLIKQLQLKGDDLKFVHKLKKEFKGTLERRDYETTAYKRTCDQIRGGVGVEGQCGAEQLFSAAKSISIVEDVFEFFSDYRKFREESRRAGKNN